MNAISPMNATSAIAGKGNVSTQLKAAQGANSTAAKAVQTASDAPDAKPVFDQFVGETFYGQMLQAMRKTQHKSAYFNGGRAEEVFQGQLDQVMSQQMSQATAGQFSGPMYELFNLQRS